MTDSPAIVAPAQESEAEFRKWVRDEFKHVRDMQKHTNETLETILRILKHDEEQHEAEHA